MVERRISPAARNGLVPAAILVGLALIVCALIGAYTVLRARSQGQTIRVTGAAYKPIKSNLAVWWADISATEPALEAGYARLKSDIAALEAFLEGQGYARSKYTLTPVAISKNYNRDRAITGFNLTRTVRLESTDVDAVNELAGAASGLIERGVMIQSRPIMYLFTGLDSLKLEMIRSATENSLARAERLAEATGCEVGAPTSASVGVFQIRALRSQEVSSRGISDVSSIDKEIVSTVHIDFMIE